MAKDGSREKVLLAALACAGGALNLFPLELIPGVNVWFGALFAALGLAVVPGWTGCLASFVAAIGLAWGMRDPFVAVILAVEAVWLARFCKQGLSPLTCSARFWIFAGLPIAWLEQHFWQHLDVRSSVIGAAQFPVNSMLGLAAAEICVLTPGLRGLLLPGSPLPLHPLRNYLLRGLAAAGVLPLLIFGLCLGGQVAHQRFSDAQNQLFWRTRQVAADASDYLRQHVVALQAFAKTVDTRLPAGAKGLGGAIQSQYHGFSSIWAVENKINVSIGGVSDDVTRLALDSQAKQAVASGMPWISQPVLDEKGRMQVLTVVPAFGAERRDGSAVLAWLSLDGLVAPGNAFKDLPEVKWIVCDASFRNIVSGDALPPLGDVSGSPMINAAHDQSGNRTYQFLETHEGRLGPGRRSFGAQVSTQLPDGERAWKVIASQPGSVAFAGIWDYMLPAFGAGLGSLLLCLALSRSMAAYLTEPLDILMAKVAALNLDAAKVAQQRKLSGPKELVDLDAVFEVMTERVQKSYAQVKSALNERERANGELVVALTSLDQKVADRTRELEATLIRAEAATKAKTEFLANMSHEIRTPMNGVLGMVQLLNESPLTAEQREMMGLIRSSSQGLLVMLSDILDFSRIESGKLELHCKPFDLPKLCADICGNFDNAAAERGLIYQKDIPASGMKRVVGDADRLGQVLQNFLSNAFKFTERGRILVRIRVNHLTPASAKLRCEVEDSGVGMEKDIVSRLFKPFNQADNSSTRVHGGAGLGLAICRQLVELMRGQIGVRSKPREGSSFWFEVPLEFDPESSAAPKPVPSKAPAPTRPMELLVVQEPDSDRTVIRKVLDRLGHQVRTASTGDDLLSSWLAGDRFDVVFIQIGMSGMDGMDAIRQVRELEAKSPIRLRSIFAVALVEDRFRGDKERLEKAGFDELISKPVKIDELLAALGRASERKIASVEQSVSS